MKTKFAPAVREIQERIFNEYNLLLKKENIEKLINALPYMGAILNDKRQVVFANRMLLEILNLKTINEILGMRPGEVLFCKNAHKEIGGCGTSENCKYCGAVNSILESQATGQQVNKIARINADINGEIVAYDFSVTSSPVNWSGKTYYVFSLVDISSDLRRKALEKIFFHDIINKTGSINGLLQVMKFEKDAEKVAEFIDLLTHTSQDLTEEILIQRDLTNAESGELLVENTTIGAYELVSVSIQQIKNHEVARGKKLIAEEIPENIMVNSYPLYLKRILTNMLKNALEASKIGETITAGCKIMDSSVRFWVKNSAVMPKEVQMQVFLRSYSTKGVGRGLGTYSMKLLGEKYLKGKVDFVSDSLSGTTFYIDLPRA